MRERALMGPAWMVLAGLLALGCGGGDDGGFNVNDDDSPFRVLVPHASQVFVRVDGTHFFESANPAGGEPLGSCTLSLGGDFDFSLIGGPSIGIPNVMLANFQRSLPRGTDDSFSMQIQDDFVQWGLSDITNGAEWVSKPGGSLTGGCNAAGSGVLCTVNWQGDANGSINVGGNIQVEEQEATVEMFCLFGAVPPCAISCGDGNPCTLDRCVNSECMRRDLPEGATCGPDVERSGRQLPQVCTADGQCVVPRLF